jgi:hypothetical protein
MIIYDPYPVSVSVSPTEYDPPLVVDSDGVKAVQVSPPFLKSIGRRHAEVVEPRCHVDCYELSFCSVGKTVKGADQFVFEERLRLAVTERPDHQEAVYRIPVCDQCAWLRSCCKTTTAGTALLARRRILGNRRPGAGARRPYRRHGLLHPQAPSRIVVPFGRFPLVGFRRI